MAVERRSVTKQERERTMLTFAELVHSEFFVRSEYIFKVDT